MARQETGGLSTVLALLGVRGAAPGAGGGDAAGGQVDLFGNSEAPLPLAAKGKSGPRGGRPAGSVNRSTEEWARYLLSQYQSPLVVLAELYSRPLDELVDELQAMADKHATVRVGAGEGAGLSVRVARVNPLDVLKLQRDAAVALAPYLHKQQPKALEFDSKPRGVVLLGDQVADAETVPDDDVALPLAPPVENAGVSAMQPQQSHTKKSHEHE